MQKDNGIKQIAKPGIREGRRKGMPNPRKWSEFIPVQAYEYASKGMTNKQVANALGVSGAMFNKWVLRHASLEDALKRARAPRETVDHLINQLRNRMSDQTLELWDKLTAWQDEPNAIRKIEKLLTKRGTYARQLLFVNALYAFSFNINEACRFVNIRRSTVDKWVMSQPGFAELFDEVKEAMSDLFVSNLVKASNAGDVSATIFACKTLARDRGFQEKLEVEHTHKGSLAIEHMNLSPKVLRELRNALRDQRNDPGRNYGDSRKKKKRIESDEEDDIIEGEFTKKSEDEEE